jgi:hypothetical protein
MIGTLGQFVREIRDLLTGSGDPIPVDIVGGDITIDNVTVSNEVEIKNDEGNPIPVNGTVNTLTGLSIPPHDQVVLDPPAQPTTVTYYLDSVFVAQVGLSYDEGDNLEEVTVTYVDPEA